MHLIYATYTIVYPFLCFVRSPPAPSNKFRIALSFPLTRLFCIALSLFSVFHTAPTLSYLTKPTPVASLACVRHSECILYLSLSFPLSVSPSPFLPKPLYLPHLPTYLFAAASLVPGQYSVSCGTYRERPLTLTSSSGCSSSISFPTSRTCRRRMEAIAKHDFTATAEDELSFRRCQILKVGRSQGTTWSLESKLDDLHSRPTAKRVASLRGHGTSADPETSIVHPFVAARRHAANDALAAKRIVKTRIVYADVHICYRRPVLAMTGTSCCI